MCGDSSTVGKNNKSVYKFIKNLTESTKMPRCSPNLLFKEFVCSICFKSIIEIRTKGCGHTTCYQCEPKYCSKKCRSTLIETITDCSMLQEKLMEGYELCGMFINGEIIKFENLQNK
uniref:Uncharacterized protein n=1 Tax=Schizaphis graminum TaxID=13262 RepID=A0A2S2PPR9_SCHGA